MDSRDSSSTSKDSGSGSVAVTGDEDVNLSVASLLAKQAAFLFDSKKYSECLDVLNQISQKTKDDPKVLHNTIVAEYFRDGCPDPRKVLELLNKVKKRSEDLARAYGEKVEALNNQENNAISGSKHHQLSVTSASVTFTEEHDTSVVTLNIAVVLFHLHEYAKALSYLEPLYHNLEPIDETTALNICLLLLDVALISNNAARATDVLQHLEKALGIGYIVGQAEVGSTASSHYSHPPAKSSSTLSNSTSLEISTSDSASNASENPLVRTLSDETLDYENFLSTLDIGGQNLVRPPGLLSSNDLLKSSVDRSGPALDLKLKLHLYKVRLLILTRNLKAAKREVKIAMNIARARDSSTALLLKSQLEYARGNHRKAIKLLMTSCNRTEAGMPSIFNNNLGCIYNQLRKHHTSTVFFSKALKSSSRLRSEKPLKLPTFSQDKSLLIVYNCGMQYLICGKPFVAAQCFQKAGLVFYNQPLLWLRIAECCLLALEKGFLEVTRVPNNEEIRLHVVGKGKWRHLIVEDRESTVNHLDNTEHKDGSMSSSDQQKLSIPFAQRCLLNALHLLNNFELSLSKDALPSPVDEDESNQRSPKDSNHKTLSVGDSRASNISQANANGDANDSKGAASLNTTTQSSASVYEDRRRENNMIKQAVLADLAFVELTLENPLKALSAAESLLRLPECSRILIFLGHMYAAEALCHLNRPKEAAEHLSVYMLDGINANFPYSEEDREKWRGEKAVDGEEVNGGFVVGKREQVEDIQDAALLKPPEALGTLFVNFAAMFGMQGDLEQAHHFASEALAVIPNNRQAILTAVYVDLMFGKSHDALVKLKECSRVRFLPSGVTFSKST
ncbi:Ccr4-not transcription complex subunit [Thalictrum thalictroides]|uniref:Ccr4-not transcription complex subunit n=1 Tax=Thalictrum thalictroides TaxID=46969 RepID=A0A7J6V007_THATH|nr:Ccr4-not transcription complex subunit [Thalictrum thalictroides]